ncbi:phosphatase PAP2 family protein [Hymenobacter rubidus]|uniref:phosphatase PAP2 family protein n=1 Tax=Hymenobacter rubidus TaxID=1441626 RepID=UPI00191F8A58|nr:phosphatase PAP2 family protein [Hymenobacter rubidus]
MNRFSSRLLALAGLLTLEVVLGAVVFVAAFAVFFYLVRVVFVHHSVALDNWAAGVMDSLRLAHPGLTGPVRFVTFFAAMPFLLPASIAVPVLLRRLGRPREAWEMVFVMAGSVLLNQLLKLYFNRPRPTNALLHTFGLSFPSGHAMLGFTFYGGLAWLLARRFGRPGWVVPLLLWAGLIGLTRVYLHAHYATDVLAGFAGGAAWLLAFRAGLKLFWKEEVAVMGAESADPDART